MPGPFGLTTQPGTNGAGIGLPMAGLSVPPPPLPPTLRLSHVSACPGEPGPSPNRCSMFSVKGNCPPPGTGSSLAFGNGLFPCLPHLTTPSPRRGTWQVWSWCDRVPLAPGGAEFRPSPQLMPPHHQPLERQ